MDKGFKVVNHLQKYKKKKRNPQSNTGITNGLLITRQGQSQMQ